MTQQPSDTGSSGNELRRVSSGTLEYIYTPFELASILCDSLKTKEAIPLLRVRGQYHDRRGRNYSGSYYDQLRDEISGHMLTIRLPEKLKALMQGGRRYVLSGLLEKKIYSPSAEIGIQLCFAVTNLVSEQPFAADPAAAERTDLLGAKADRGFRPVDAIIKQRFKARQIPRLAFVFGTSAVIDQDVMSALGKARYLYHIKVLRVSLIDKRAIISVLQELDRGKDFDLIGIVRGGGWRLEIFDDLELARVVVNLQTPLVTAIGHEVDRTFVDRIADRRFSTPTDLGRVLCELAREAFMEISTTQTPNNAVEEKFKQNEQAFGRKETEYLNSIRILNEQCAALQAENGALKNKSLPSNYAKAKKIAWALFWLIIGTIVSYVALFTFVVATPLIMLPHVV